jgi:hypothetical protein
MAGTREKHPSRLFVWFQRPEACRCWRQRSLQYFTSSQTRSHFFRQANGRPQTGQVLVGRLDFLMPRITLVKQRKRLNGYTKNNLALCA